MKNTQFSKGFSSIAVTTASAVALSVVLGGGVLYYKNLPISDSMAKTEVAEAVSNPNQKDCGNDINCLIDAAKTCSLAKVETTLTIDLSKMFGIPDSEGQPHMIQIQTNAQEIKGVVDGKCVYFNKLLSVENPDMTPEVKAQVIHEGEMTCSYESGDLVARLENIEKGNYFGEFDSNDTPAQRLEKRCKNYGADVE